MTQCQNYLFLHSTALSTNSPFPTTPLTLLYQIIKYLYSISLQLTTKRMMRNKNYDAIKQKVIKQKKREQTVGWREWEMFVDKSRYTRRGSRLWAGERGRCL